MISGRGAAVAPDGVNIGVCTGTADDAPVETGLGVPLRPKPQAPQNVAPGSCAVAHRGQVAIPQEPQRKPAYYVYHTGPVRLKVGRGSATESADHAFHVAEDHTGAARQLAGHDRERQQ